MSDEPKAGGTMAQARSLAASLLGLARTRVELLATEWQEEKYRAIRLLVWLAIAGALIAAAVLLVVGTLALFLWQSAGYAGLVGLVLATLGAGAGILWWLRRSLRVEPAPFAATAAEFRKDVECLRREN